MARRHSHLSMRRIVVIAVLAIIVPSLVLTLVGLKLTLDLKSQLEQSLADQYATSVRSKVADVEAAVEDLEARIRREADRLAPEQVNARLDAIRRQSPIVDELFFLKFEELASDAAVLQRLRMLYPAEPEPAPTVPETFLWGEPLPAAARPSKADGSPATYEETIETLLRYRNRSLSPAARARATQALAATHFRNGKFPEAITEYRHLLQTDNVGLFSPSLALLARYQIAVAELKLGQAQDALVSLLDLYESLVRETTGVSDPGRIAWFRQRLRGDVESVLAGGEAARPLRARYAALLEEEKSRAARARFLAYLRRFILPLLALQTASLRPSREGFDHHWDDALDEEPYVVAYTMVRSSDGDRRILGFKMNLAYVRDKLFAEALRSSRLGDRVAFVVADRKGGAVYGDRGGRAVAASEPFGIFKTWRLGLVEREPAELRRLALYNVLLFTAVNGLMIVAIIVGVIITLRGTARELELSQLKSDFVSNVSHELKTPLALIRMFAETLQLGRVRNPEKAQEYYSIITRESERLTQLINNVLDFSRIEGGRKTYDLRLDDLGDVVRDTLHAYSYELAKQGFTVEADVPDGLPETLMDRNAISLALLNLLSNAVKYSRDDRRIRVSCAARNGSLVLDVADHGIGIDPEDQDKIFDKFYRAPDEAVRATRGSGLGLAIVRHSIEAHDGTIAIFSRKGEGSTFTITLPIRETLTDGARG